MGMFLWSGQPKLSGCFVQQQRVDETNVVVRCGNLVGPQPVFLTALPHEVGQRRVIVAVPIGTVKLFGEIHVTKITFMRVLDIQFERHLEVHGVGNQVVIRPLVRGLDAVPLHHDHLIGLNPRR